VPARKVSAQGLVDFRGNQYSVPPGMPGAQVTVRLRSGAVFDTGKEAFQQ
jgi:hypothetical protein